MVIKAVIHTAVLAGEETGSCRQMKVRPVSSMLKDFSTDQAAVLIFHFLP